MIESTNRQIGRKTGLVGVSAATIVIIALVLFITTYQTSSAPRSGSGSVIASSVLRSSGQNTTISSGMETSMATTVSYALFACNCSVDIRWAWPNYTSLSSLGSASESIVVANVISTQTAGVPAPSYGNLSLNGVVPVTGYKVNITQVLVGPPSLTPGDTIWVAAIGGTVNGTTMSVNGYPQLSEGGTYVFFLNASGTTLTPFYGAVGNANELVTVGGPQGLFYIQGGNVYSLDHMFPKADAWLPFKVNGTPLDQFVQQVQSALSPNTLTSTTSSSSAVVAG